MTEGNDDVPRWPDGSPRLINGEPWKPQPLKRLEPPPKKTRAINYPLLLRALMYLGISLICFSLLAKMLF